MCFLVCDKLLFVLLGQACEHQTKHGQVDHGLTTAGQVLLVLAHAPIAANPGQGAFDDPATLPPQTVFCFCVLVIVHSFRDSLV